jgi:hypothetical protein
LFATNFHDEEQHNCLSNDFSGTFVLTMPSAELFFKKRQTFPSWLDIVWKSLYQLTQLHPNREYFHYHQDLCQYIERNWQRLAQGKDRTATWTNTVSSTITTHKLIFKPGAEHGFWGLRKRPDDKTPLAVLRATNPYEEVAADLPTQSSSPSKRSGKRGVSVKKHRPELESESDASEYEEESVQQSPKRQRLSYSDADSDSSTSGFLSDSSPSVVHLPVLPPIYHSSEEEYVDIEGCSEDDIFGDRARAVSCEAPDTPPVWCESSLVDANNYSMASFTVPASEAWFQSLFAM